MSLALGSRGGGDDGFKGVDASIGHLYSQRASSPSPDDQHGSAMHQRPERQHKAGMVARRSTQLLRKTLAEQIERGPGLVQRRRLCNSVEENLVRMAALEGEFQIALATLPQ